MSIPLTTSTSSVPITTTTIQQQPSQPQQPIHIYDPNGIILHEPYPAQDAINHRIAKSFPPSHEECHLIRRLRLTFYDTTTIVLPVESLEEQPRFVNSRQYARIVARRQQRAKHGVPARLPNGERVKVKYASRQQHAYRRGRGAGGQFLKKGSLAPSQVDTDPSNPLHLSTSPSLLDSGNMFDFTDDAILIKDEDDDVEDDLQLT